jgi:hypothetical protein
MKDIWPKNAVYYNDYIAFNDDTAYIAKLDSRKMYLAVNLRRTDDSDLTIDSDIIATIKVKYFNKVLDDTLLVLNSGYIQFDSAATASSIYYSNRGYIDNALSAVPSGTDEFVIRRNMLPIAGTNRRDVTLSAFFTAAKEDETDESSPNPLFKIKENSFTIDSIDIEVYYHGKSNIALDWVRLETPFARRVLRGYLDSAITHNLSRNIDSLKAYNQRTSKDIRVVKIYGRDEFNMMYWRTHRYLNKLFNNMMETESGVGYTNMYEHHTQNTGYWNSGTFRPTGLTTPPMIPQSDTIGWKTFDYKGGYRYGNHDTSLAWYSLSETQIFNGHYETWLWKYGIRSFSQVNEQASDADYIETVHKQSDSYLANYERTAYEYLSPNSPALGMFYSSKPWWAQIWQTQNIAVDTLNKRMGVSGDGPRIKTGEELRCMAWQYLILGAKGLMYDRAYSSSPYSGLLPLVGFTSGTGSAESTWGGDYFTNPDSSGFHALINFPVVAAAMGLQDTNHIYIGRKSQRGVAKGINTWAMHNSDELMRLRLVGWYAKGFRTFVNGDSAALKMRLKLPALFNTLLSSPPSPLTRPAWRSEPEEWDSAFVDYTVLRDTNRNIDSVWFVGVQNRRTSPLILSPGFGSLGDMARFVTTDEFNTIAAITPSRRYKQGGARTITIPFGNIDTVTASKIWVTYHVEELHDGQPPLPGIKRIDTTIIQGTPLAVNFLPGEGKMFRVTVIRPEKNLDSGLLSHSNQRKLIAYPIVSSTGQLVRDTVRYHLAYHKARSPKPKDGVIDYGVYYQRSVPVPRQYPADMIEWEPMEYCLTDSVQTSLMIDTLDCAYPSIVVRQGSDSIARVHIVYGCLNKDAVISIQDTFVVAEHVFPANALYISPGVGSIIARVNAPNYSDYVTPMINASRNGNYYTWADRKRGIGLGFKTAGSTTLADTAYISWSVSQGDTLNKAQHPSLNTYSRISLGEDDCALVWQETLPNRPQSQINYTRLRLISGVITPYLPQGGFFDTTLTVATNTAVTIANLSDRTIKATEQSFPVIYRGVEDYMPPCSTDLHIGHSDKVVWQARHYITENQHREFICALGPPEVPMLLLHRTIDHRDSIDRGVYVPWDWGVTPTEKIWAGNGNLSQPTISQGGGVNIPTNHTNFSDSAMLLNFKSTAICSTGITGLGDIWNLPFGYWTVLKNNSDNTNNLTYASPIVFNGQYPQLAAIPAMGYLNNREWRRNRRVFEATTASNPNNPTILASSQYFLRSAKDEPAYAFSGFARDSVRYVITPPKIAGSYVPLSPLKTPIARLQPCHGVFKGREDFLDTISTGWVDIQAGQSIVYYGLGTDTAAVRIILERQSTNTKVELAKPPGTDIAAMDASYVIALGDGDFYRLLLIKKDPSTHYLEELVVSELPLLDEGGVGRRSALAYEEALDRAKTRTITKGILSCALSPNPARDIIRITVSGTAIQEPVRIVVSNLLGETMRVLEAKTLVEAQIPLEGLPSGQYMMRSQLIRNEFFEPLVMPFVIER